MQKNVLGRNQTAAGGDGERVDVWRSSHGKHVMVTVYDGEAWAFSDGKRHSDSLSGGPNVSVTCKAGPDYAECWLGTGAIS